MDARRVTRGTTEMLVVRQQERLNELVAFARANSRFYAEKYRGLPENITDVRHGVTEIGRQFGEGDGEWEKEAQHERPCWDGTKRNIIFVAIIRKSCFYPPIMRAVVPGSTS